MPSPTTLIRSGVGWLWKPNPPYGKACDKCGKEIKDGDPAWLRCKDGQDWSFHIGCQPWGYPHKGTPLLKRWYWKLKIKFRKIMPKPQQDFYSPVINDLGVRINVHLKPEDWNDVQVSKREKYDLTQEEVQGDG